MHEPVTALVSFGAGSLLAALLLWPRRGLLARYLARRRTDQMLVEDALKHLYNEERTGRWGGLEGVAGALEISRARAAELLGEMEAAGLVRWEARGLELTASGRRYALQVLRSHRLWERYLADRTGLSPGEWHAEADRLEHELSSEEADQLSAELGYPRYDPHGDPIPGPDGRMPPAEGVSLTSLPAGSVGVVVHMEDEPVEIYEGLAEAGLGPGTQLEVLSGGEGEVRIRAAGREHRLDPLAAASIEVEELAGEWESEAGIETLAALRLGESAEVVRISPACQGPQRRRLLDLGVVPGTVIEARLQSASGDPMAYEIRGALIALRREQASRILVRRSSGESSEEGEAVGAEARSAVGGEGC